MGCIREQLQAMADRIQVKTVDLAEVSEMDSALLALLLAWTREALARSGKLGFANAPESLRTIARLYGVDALLAL